MSYRTNFKWMTLALLTCLFVGCADSSVQTASTEGGEEPPAATGVPTIPNSMTSAIPGASGAAVEQPSGSALPSGEGERVIAEAGVGKQGQSLKDEKGVGAMIVQPARSLFAVKQRAVFEIQIPSAVKLFQATEGRKPKSHEEYMSKIIKANQIKLPELPAGQTYVYDPELGELMVQKSGG